MEEYVMLGLRLKKGISLKTLREKYQVSPQKLQNAAQRLSPLQKAGLLEWKGDSVALTREGFLVSNSVIVEIIETLE